MKQTHYIKCLGLSLVSLCVFTPGLVSGQIAVSLEVKAFLEHPPSIENVTFAKLGKGTGDKSGLSVDGKLFTASVQNESFVMAELRTPDEVPRMSTRGLPIAGKSDSLRWSILGTTLHLGPTTNSVVEAKDPAVTLSETFESLLDEPMGLGIYHAERGALQVAESGEFFGPIAKRLHSWGPSSEIKGRLTFTPNGTRLESAAWQISTKPEMFFRVEYFYDAGQTNFFPAGWECSVTKHGQYLPKYQIKILKFKLATSPLPVDTFLPGRFASDAKLPGPGPIILIRSNGNTFWLQDGKFRPSPDAATSTSRTGSIGFILALTIASGGLFFLLRSVFARAKQRKGA